MVRIGRATAEQVRATGITWVFAPTLAVVQNPRWGRTYESYSSDPEIVRDSRQRLSDLEIEPIILENAWASDQEKRFVQTHFKIA